MDISKQSPEWEKYITQLRDIAEQKDITQDEIVERTGMIQSAISRFFKRKFNPKLSTVLLIAEAIGVEIKIVDKE